MAADQAGGSVSVISVPCPGWLLAVRWPPCARASSAATDRPMPLPETRAAPWPNGIWLRWYRYQPESDNGERGEPGCLAGLAGFVPAAGALGLAGIAASWPLRHQVPPAGDLEGQVGDEFAEAVRGKRSRGR